MRKCVPSRGRRLVGSKADVDRFIRTGFVRRSKGQFNDLLTHIVLLGDSIFDNRSYTGAEPDVVTHLRALLPEGARATLLAVDGATTRSMTGQVAELPGDATHVVVSVGGNDALGHAHSWKTQSPGEQSPAMYDANGIHPRFGAASQYTVAPQYLQLPMPRWTPKTGH